jgi:hypothetical protein
MPIKARDAPTDVTTIDRYADGVGWIAHPGETMQRASHAIATEAGVLVVDPVDGPGVDGLIDEFGELAGIVVTFDQHSRDAVDVAARHDVPIYVPEPVRAGKTLRRNGADGGNGGPSIERIADTVPGTALDVVVLHERRAWGEVALYRDRDGVLYVPESVGTAAYFRATGERLGVHPMIRPIPPRRQLSGMSPDRLLVAHGEGIPDDATDALESALAGSRRRLPSAYWNAFKAVVGS